MIQLTHAQVSYPSGKLVRYVRSALFADRFEKEREKALQDVTLWLGKGESWAVLGGEGAGKTALLRLIAGHIPPSAGGCVVEGRVAAAIRGEDGLIEKETGENNVVLACALEGLEKEATRAMTERVKTLSGLEDAYNKPVTTYTEAMRARLAISMALAAKPNVLVVSRLLERCGLPYMQRYIMQIRADVKEGMTVLVESGEYAMLTRLCESAIWMEEGRIRRLGRYEVVLDAYRALKKAPDVPENQEKIKRWLAEQQAAFSSALAPAWKELQRREGWPDEARAAVEAAENMAKRLNEQLTAYAHANLAFEQENERLGDALKSQVARAKEAEEQLTRVIASVADTLRVMHAQFEAIAKLLPASGRRIAK